CVGVAGASWAAARLPFVGPDNVEAVLGVRHLLGRVVAGFVEAARTLPRRGRLLLSLVLLTRLPFGFFLLQTLLLVRHQTATGDQAVAIATAAAAAAAGFALAAFLTPWLLPRMGSIRYAAGVLAVGALGCVTLGPWLAPWSMSALGFVVGVSSQGVKITVDSLLQTHVPDHLLGRAFSVYDVMYNAGLVVAAASAAVLLPASGLVWWPFVVFAALYLALALAIGPLWQRVSRADETRPLG
ncbi:MAG: MFS transporter, partial [Terracoccus sp.]